MGRKKGKPKPAESGDQRPEQSSSSRQQPQQQPPQAQATDFPSLGTPRHSPSGPPAAESPRQPPQWRQEQPQQGPPPPQQQHQQGPGYQQPQQQGQPQRGRGGGRPGQQQQRPPGQYQQQRPPQPAPFQQQGPPPVQYQQRGPAQQQQQRGPLQTAPYKQQGPPPGQYQQRGPPQQQQRQRGPPQTAPYQQQGPPLVQHQQRGPPEQQQQRGPPTPQAYEPESPPPDERPQKQARRGSTEVAKTSQKISPEEKGKEETQLVKYELQLAEKKGPRRGGTKGRKILLETNHFALNLGKLARNAVHYDVAIDPDRPKTALRHVMEAFREKYYPQRYPAFDGRKNLYASSELPFGEQISGEVQVQLEDQLKKYKVTVKYAAYVDLTAIEKFLTATSSGQRHLVTPQDAIHCVDVVLRSAPSIRCIGVGRSFFTPPDRGQILELGDGMEMYYGFYQSAILGWKPFLNVDVAHKAFPKRQPVLDLIRELFRGELASLQGYQRETLEKYLKTLKVQYEIPNHPSTRRVYRVNGLRGSAKQETFQCDQSNTRITVALYFATVKAHPLKYPDLPLLWVGNRERTTPLLLPVEFCTVLENQAVNRKMNEIQTSKMIRYAATNTSDRKAKIMRAHTTANYNDNPAVREFNFSVSSQFEKVEGRVLDPPMLRYQKNQIKPSRGQWRVENTQFINPANLVKWTVLCLDYRTRQDALDRLIDMLPRMGRQLGMQIAPCERPTTLQLPRSRELDDLKNFFTSKKSYNLIIVVIPDSGPYYSYVKEAAEINVGCLTQCLKAKTLYKSLNASTIGNILLKVNAKLNGLNHTLSNKPLCLLRPCMFMGADVTHPPPDSQNVPSVAAVTASHDPTAFKYNICWRLQPPKAEIIEDLENIVKEHLLFFFKNNNQAKPERIIFFRDGVSEGYFEMVMNKEVQAIRKACLSLERDGSYKPAITFLVVQKRHHTRFFPTNPRDSEDKNQNVPAGTCVDTVITHPTAQDFYLVSHASIQGVAKPTKYRTLWDDSDMSDDELEELTYYLCHMFTRCNRSVSYPAPTYYAHLAAARAKVYCENKHLNLGRLQAEQIKLTIKDEVVKGMPMFFV